MPVERISRRIAESQETQTDGSQLKKMVQLTIVNFTVVLKWLAFSKNHTSDSEFQSFPG